MAAENYLASSYRFLRLVNITDVQTIIDNVAAELLANIPAWSSEGGGVYKSPVDSDGRFFKITLTKIAGDNFHLDMLVKDQNAVSICQRRLIIAAAGNVAYIYSGQYHICIDVQVSGAAPESLYAGILDYSPEAQSASSRYVYGGGSRDTSNSLALNTVSQVAMLDNITATLGHRCKQWCMDGGSGGPNRTLGGLIKPRPREMFASTATVTKAFAGRGYQQIMVPSSICETGSLMAIPIDTNLIGYFRLVGGQLVSRAMMVAYRAS